MTTKKTCDVCNSTQLSHELDTADYFLTQENFSLFRCNECGYAFTSPAPPTSKLGKYYESKEYLSHTADEKGFMNSLYKILRSINLQRKEKLILQHSAPGELLDIGSGTGEFLSYCKKRNWSVTGIEPNTKARQFASDQYKLTIHPEEKIAELKNNYYDIITMWHVLEHVPDFNERIEQIKKILKPNGTIVIALPNINSPDAQKYGKYWAALDVPRHLHHFSPKSIAKLSQQHHLKLIDMVPMKMDAYYVSLLSEKYLNHNLPLIRGAYNGFVSNLKAFKNNNYSSMIFVLKK